MEHPFSKSELRQIIRASVKSVFEEFFPKDKPNLNPEFITMKELCSFLKVSRVTIHAWMNKGILAFSKVGGKLLFDKQAILIKMQTEPAQFGKGRDSLYSSIKPRMVELLDLEKLNPKNYKE